MNGLNNHHHHHQLHQEEDRAESRDQKKTMQMQVYTHLIQEEKDKNQGQASGSNGQRDQFDLGELTRKVILCLVLSVRTKVRFTYEFRHGEDRCKNSMVDNDFVYLRLRFSFDFVDFYDFAWKAGVASVGLSVLIDCCLCGGGHVKGCQRANLHFDSLNGFASSLSYPSPSHPLPDFGRVITSVFFGKNG